eukprot:6211946-Prymnesium_polylepis.1
MRRPWRPCAPWTSSRWGTASWSSRRRAWRAVRGDGRSRGCLRRTSPGRRAPAPRLARGPPGRAAQSAREVEPVPRRGGVGAPDALHRVRRLAAAPPAALVPDVDRAIGEHRVHVGAVAAWRKRRRHGDAVSDKQHVGPVLSQLCRPVAARGRRRCRRRDLARRVKRGAAAVARRDGAFAAGGAAPRQHPA